jgi:carbamoyl-phosphate synthase large subunit
MRILITGVGGPTPRSFAISLKKYSFYKRFELFATDINPLSMGLYQGDLFSKSFIVPRCTDIDYWDRINEIVKENNIEYAVILPELEVMEWSKRSEAGLLPCKVLLPDSRIASLLVDKARMTEILDHLGLVPPSVEFERSQTDLTPIFEKLGANFWVRSTSGTSGLGSLQIDSAASLKNWVQINPGVKTFIASKFLPGRNLACKLLYHNGELLRSACGERVNYIMAKVAPSGITGNTSFGRLLNEPKLVDLATKAMTFLFDYLKIKPHGFFTVDFKEDEKGVPFITEVNVRHVAFTQCFAAGGANFAEDTIRLLDEDPTFDRTYKMYTFEKDLIFLRDVDSLPILMKEHQLLK